MPRPLKTLEAPDKPDPLYSGAPVCAKVKEIRGQGSFAPGTVPRSSPGRNRREGSGRIEKSKQVILNDRRYIVCFKTLAQAPQGGPGTETRSSWPLDAQLKKGRQEPSGQQRLSQVSDD